MDYSVALGHIVAPTLIQYNCGMYTSLQGTNCTSFAVLGLWKYDAVCTGTRRGNIWIHSNSHPRVQ